MRKKTDINFGDLVRLDGHGGELFFVDSYSIEYHFGPDREYTDVCYDLTSAFGGGYTMGFEEDIERVCGAEAADDYLMYHASPPQPTKSSKYMITINIDEFIAEYSFNESGRCKEINDLLIELSDYLTLKEMFDTAEYDEEIERIKGNLRKITEAR